MAVWETKTKEQIATFLKKSKKVLEALVQKDAVEADTRTFVTDLLVEGLGYDKYQELTAEYLVRGEFADIGVRVDGQILCFVEIKRIGTPLVDKHLRQVKSYAANEGVEWVILTNGRVWQTYHISNSTPIEHHLLRECDLLSDSKSQEKVEALFDISRESMKRGLLRSRWSLMAAVQPNRLKSIFLSDRVVSTIRAELRKENGQLVPEQLLRESISGLLKD